MLENLNSPQYSNFNSETKYKCFVHFIIIFLSIFNLNQTIKPDQTILQVLWKTVAVSELSSGCWASYKFVKLFLKIGQKFGFLVFGISDWLDLGEQDKGQQNQLIFFLIIGLTALRKKPNKNSSKLRYRKSSGKPSTTCWRITNSFAPPF